MRRGFNFANSNPQGIPSILLLYSLHPSHIPSPSYSYTLSILLLYPLHPSPMPSSSFSYTLPILLLYPLYPFLIPSPSNSYTHSILLIYHLHPSPIPVPVQTSDPQTSDGTNIRLTNVGQYKRRTSTNIGPVQTSDRYKRQTGTNVVPVQTSDGYISKEKRRTKEEKIYLNFQIKILVNSQFSLKKFPFFC